jgi:hypothetical protein
MEDNKIIETPVSPETPKPEEKAPAENKKDLTNEPETGTENISVIPPFTFNKELYLKNGGNEELIPLMEEAKINLTEKNIAEISNKYKACFTKNVSPEEQSKELTPMEKRILRNKEELLR